MFSVPSARRGGGVAVALCLDPMSLKQFVNRQNAYVGILCTNDDANIPGVFRHTSSASTLHAQAPAPLWRIDQTLRLG
ncbi:hypothetical protein EVAR_41855_1 [Eumeta japonica]|uniref:Uncharacterized protein n=1 Tax=Eumeta variegata TaxID=151549 RepID=A0A4C1XDB6_EUMVA|nr:hypothetical protein EVAR_41855_1 [Eumeta japonica]